VENYVYTIEGCQMVALSFHIDLYWYYSNAPLGTVMYVNLKNGVDTPLGKNPYENPDYTVGYFYNNELRVSVSYDKEL
jgi:hypothetical protein